MGTSGQSGYPTNESPLLGEYERARRWSLGEISQEKLAMYMCSRAGTVSIDETNGRPWNRTPAWDFRRGAGHGLLLIGADNEQRMAFWHEVNKIWVAVPREGLFVPDPYEMTYEQVLAEVYSDVAAAKRDPRYQNYEAGCRRMRDAR